MSTLGADEGLALEAARNDAEDALGGTEEGVDDALACIEEHACEIFNRTHDESP